MATPRLTQDEFMARFAPPPAHADDVVVQVGSKYVWRKRVDLDGTEGVVFFDGDYRDVLEPDDPRLGA